MRRNDEPGNRYIYTNDSRRRQIDSRQHRSRHLSLESLECRRVLTSFDFPQLRTLDDAPAAAEFGKSVAIHEQFAIVGAPLDIVGGVKSGSAYVYARLASNDTNWMPVAKLGARLGSPGDRFGQSVAIDSASGIIVVGAAFDDQNGRVDSGSVYVFARDPDSGEWDQVDELVPTDATQGQLFGASVSVSDDVIVVGAPHRSADATGAAYIFQRQASNDDDWNQVEKLLPSTNSNVTHFGNSVSISGQSIIVGTNSDAGSAFIFTEPADTAADNTKWQDSQEELTAGRAGHAGDCFGYSVSIDAETEGKPPVAVVGAFCDKEAAVGSGAAYVFTRTGDTWEPTKLKASEPQSEAEFGRSVSVHGDVIVVGAPSGIVNGVKTGATYAFSRDEGNSWSEPAKLPVSHGAKGDGLGQSVAVFGDRVIVGAPGSDKSGSVNFFEQDLLVGADLSLEIAEVLTPAGLVNSYLVTVRNAGASDAEHVRTLNSLSGQGSFGFLVGCANETQAPVCALGTIPTNQSKSYVISVDAGNPTPNLHVSALSDTPDLDPSDNLGSADTILEIADLSVTMIGASEPVTAGSGNDNLPLVVVVTNEGPGEANGVEVTLTLPTLPGITLTEPAGITSAPDGTYLWDVGHLAHGESALLNLKLSVDATVEEPAITSTAKIKKPNRDSDPNPQNDSDSVTTVIVKAVPQVSIATTTAGAEAGPVSAEFTVTLSAVRTTDTVISYTLGGSAEGGVDYTSPSGSVTIAAAETSAPITVEILDDDDVDPNETLSITLSSVVLPEVQISTDPAEITIADNDPAGPVGAAALKQPMPNRISGADFHKALDTNRDGFVTSIDALLIINAINKGSSDATNGPLDVNGDGFVSSIDVLRVTNYLNNETKSPAGAGESTEVGSSLVDSVYAELDLDLITVAVALFDDSETS